MADITSLTLTQTLKALEEKEFSLEELNKAYLERIKKYNSSLNAYLFVNEQNKQSFSTSKNFTEVANISVVQTLGRSLNTSLTVVFVLLALLLFGGESIKWFVTALLIGVVSGTYSSIFNATALLVWWEEKLGH